MNVISLEKNNEIAALLEAVQVLKQGGVVVVPTDTLYGLAADARDASAVEKVFKIKGRHPGEAISVLVANADMVDTVALADARVKSILAQTGAITAVLPSRGWMPLNLRGGGLTIGVRIPDHPFLPRLIKSFGGPITGTSANASGRGGYTKIEDVLDDFSQSLQQPDLVLDAGDIHDRGPSVVVDFIQNPPKVLRTGALTLDQLHALLDTGFA